MLNYTPMLLDILEWVALIVVGLGGLIMLGALVAWLGLAVIHLARAFARGVR